MEQRVDPGRSAAHPVRVHVDGGVTGGGENGAGGAGLALGVAEVARILHRHDPARHRQPGQGSGVDQVGHHHRDVTGASSQLGPLLGPVAVLGQMSRASGGGGHHQVDSGEGLDVATGEPAGGVGGAVVSGQGTATRLLLGNHHPVAGPGQ